MILSEQHGMNNMIQLEQYEHGITYKQDDTIMQHDDVIMHQLTLFGLPRNHHGHHTIISGSKLGINNTVVIIT